AAAAPDDAVAARRRDVTRAVGEDGLAALALAAAAGLDEAHEALRTLVPDAADALVEDLRADLVRRARAQVDVERAGADAALADPDLAADASSRLRLRLAVLKGLT
ncbi:hypothetical protein E5226_17025, partial [Cellulomonas shaoxiangyii]